MSTGSETESAGEPETCGIDTDVVDGYSPCVAWKPSARSSQTQPFLAMEIMERSLVLERSGARVIHMEVGEPDFPAPPAAVEACRAALAAGDTRYTDSRGMAPLREAIAADKSRRSGAPIDPERVVVTNGTSAAMLLVFGLLVDPGDEIKHGWTRIEHGILG